MAPKKKAGKSKKQDDYWDEEFGKDAPALTPDADADVDTAPPLKSSGFDALLQEQDDDGGDSLMAQISRASKSKKKDKKKGKKDFGEEETPTLVDADAEEEEEEEEKRGKKEKKGKKGKKERDEIEYADEILDEGVEEATVVEAPKKKGKKGKKERDEIEYADEILDEGVEEAAVVEAPKKKGKKGKKDKEVIEYADEVLEEGAEEVVAETPKKKKGKKGRDVIEYADEMMGDAAEEVEAAEAETEAAAPKKKGKKGKKDKKDKAAEDDDKPVTPTPADDEDDFDMTPKNDKVKKGKKEEEPAPVSDDDFGASDDDDTGAAGSKVKSKKEKEREKKERKKEATRKAAADKKAKAEQEQRELEALLQTQGLAGSAAGKAAETKKEEAKVEAKPEVEAEVTTPAPAGAASSETKKEDDDEDGDEEEGDNVDAKKSKTKKKKKKKTVEEKKAEEEAAATAATAAAAKKGKKGPAVGALRKMLEEQRKVEEEAARRAEEERQRIEEEQRKIEEEERKQEELKQRKKEKEKAKREQLKREGKLLSPAQQAAKQRDELRLKQLLEAGVKIEGLAQKKDTEEEKKEEEKKPKRIVYAAKKKKGPQTKAEEKKEQEEEEEKKKREEEERKKKEKEDEERKAKAKEQEEEKDEWDVESEEPRIVVPVIVARPKGKEKEEAVKESWEESEEDVKESWDMESEEEKEVRLTKEKTTPPKGTVKTPTTAPAKAAAATAAAAKKSAAKKEESEEEDEDEEESDQDDSDDSEEDSDSDSDSDESSEEELTAAQRLALKRKEEAAERRKKRVEEAMNARSKDDLRSPIACILGHVDTGKTKLLDKIRQTNVQEGEAGGITQQIGATYFPVDAIKTKTEVLGDRRVAELKLPGLLVIDTPGHESFTNLRSRGSSLCNIAILVVDIMHGLEPQTLESLRLLRDRKTPFIVALNKIDRLFDWKPIADNGFIDSLAKQSPSVQREFHDRVEKTIVAFAEQGLNSCLYYDNKNFARNVSLVPTSAITGEGIPDMLNLLVELTQTRMSDKLMYITELECTVLEVKVIEGLGTTIDVVLVNGWLHEGDKIVLCGLNGPIVTTIRALLTPQPMKELRIKSAYIHHKSVKAALGIKISAQDLEKAIAGSRLLVVGPDDDEDDLKDEVMSDLTNLMSAVDRTGRGVCVQASTLGSLEALLEFLKVSKIPVSGINIGPVHKKDIMRTAVMVEKAKEYAVMLCFDVKVDKDAEDLAEEMGIKIFKADIIYHLFDAFKAYNQEITDQKRKDQAPQAVFPCVLKMVPQAIFNKKEPIIIGVDVVEGALRVGTPMCVVKTDPETKKREVIQLGKVTSMEQNHKAVEIVKKGSAGGGVAVKIECAVYETPKTYGRHFDENDEIYSRITRISIDILKESFRNDLSKEEWALVVKLKKTLMIE